MKKNFVDKAELLPGSEIGEGRYLNFTTLELEKCLILFNISISISLYNWHITLVLGISRYGLYQEITFWAGL